ncbi:hypothetical protein [Aquimarina aquimarini]|uniref:hypothetical protein n=2 Tax=Aquimarina aquimarini TaxID=1191734 RepID=UPI00131EDE49|nr:hypothetical protein [Aquimarina aquimarini]
MITTNFIEKRMALKEKRTTTVFQENHQVSGLDIALEVSYLKEFKTKSIAETVNFAYQNKSHIIVGVSLASGLYLEGHITDISQKDHHGYNICFDQPQNGLTYFYPQSIIAITIRQSLDSTLSNKYSTKRPLYC